MKCHMCEKKYMSVDKTILYWLLCHVLPTYWSLMCKSPRYFNFIN